MRTDGWYHPDAELVKALKDRAEAGNETWDDDTYEEDRILLLRAAEEIEMLRSLIKRGQLVLMGLYGPSRLEE